MRLLQTLVASVDFREAEHAWRDRIFSDLMQVASEQRANAIVLPGGFWFEPDIDSLHKRIAILEDRLPPGIVLFAGIDLAEARRRLSSKGSSGFGHHPYYGIALGVEMGSRTWQQTSVTSQDAWSVPQSDIPGQDRLVKVGDQTVGVLICGELFSEPARQSFIALRPDLILDLGHAGMGTGVTRAMEKLARLGGSAVAHSQHVASSSSSLHFVDATARRHSIVADDCEYLGGNNRWLSWTIRTI